jgi:hypothetical protein
LKGYRRDFNGIEGNADGKRRRLGEVSPGFFQKAQFMKELD